MMDKEGYSGAFYVMLIIGIVGVLGFSSWRLAPPGVCDAS